MQQLSGGLSLSSAIGTGDWKNLLSTLGLQRPTHQEVLVVSASGKRSEPTTEARIVVLVKDGGSTSDVARYACSRRANNLMATLRKIPALTRVEPLPMRVSSNKAACVLVIDSPIRDAVHICNTALRHGACKVLHIATMATENVLQAARKSASSHAIRTASLKAQRVARSKGKIASLRNVVNVESEVEFPTKDSDEIRVRKSKTGTGAIYVDLLDPIRVGQHIVTAIAHAEFTLH